MSRVVHVLVAPKSRSNWLVRSDESPDYVVRRKPLALEHARAVARTLADRCGLPVTVRVWEGKSGPKEEEVFPAASPPNPARRA